MTDTASDTPESPKKPSKAASEDILKTALSRFEMGSSALDKSRISQLDDLKFAAGSSDNNWQWPTDIINTRQGDKDGLSARPMLTVNKLPQHIRQITNDQRQNGPAGDVIPVDGDGDVQVAEVYEGLVRYIEYNSEADVAYDTACENQATHGEGYFRIVTRYVDEDSFDQDIFIERIRNSFSVIMDPTIQKPTGEDAKWCFITEDLLHDEYETMFPDAEPVSAIRNESIGNPSVGAWLNEKTIRIAEYFCYETTTEKLWLFKGGKKAFESDPQFKQYKKMYGEPIKSRDSDRKKVKWYKTNGYEILSERDWAGKYIPVVRVIGNEFEVEGEVYLSGIVRNAKDPQRMYNFWVSSEAEMLALAPKAPFIGAEGQFEGHEQKWANANVKNYPYLEYNPVIDDATGQTLPPPQRSLPPMAQSGFIAAKQSASEDIKDATGQYNASLGQTSNERSGKAILARQHEGDISTYHYGDNLSKAIRFGTRQLVDLIPKIYDTPRVVMIIGEDGITKMANLDPTQQGAVNEIPHPFDPNVIIQKIYNPAFGKYGVRVTTGPGYTTKRQQAIDAMLQVSQSNENLWAIAGDLIVKYMDWPGAQELSARIAKSIDPKLLQDTDNPALQQAQSQIQQLNQELQQAHGMLQNINNSMEAQDLSVKKFEAQIKMYDAQTKRIAATAQAANAATNDKSITTPEQVHDIVMGILHAAMASGDIPGNAPIQPQQDDQQAPPLDPNKVMTETSKHVLQANQHDHEMQMAQLQAQQQAQQPEGGQDAVSAATQPAQ